MNPNPTLEDVIYRRYEPKDKENVWNLHVLALNQVKGLQYTHGSWEKDLEDIEGFYLNPGGEFLVAESGGKLIGMGALQRISETCGEIKRMRVHPDCWRMGIGQNILTRLETVAKSKGMDVLELDTTVYQEAAQKLYLKNHYREVKRGKKGPFDTIFFKKEI